MIMIIVTTWQNFSQFLLIQPKLKILHTLLDNEKCVKNICEIIELNQSTCSHQLKILRQYKVVKAKREGKFIR